MSGLDVKWEGVDEGSNTRLLIGVPQMEVYLVLIGIITIDEVHTKWEIRYQRQVVTCLMGSISSLDFGMIL